MTKEFDLDTYLIVTNFKFKICIFDIKNFKTVYIQELKFKDKSETIDFNSLSKFLENNIFKIEKLTSKFINNIIIVIDSEEDKTRMLKSYTWKDLLVDGAIVTVVLGIIF